MTAVRIAAPAQALFRCTLCGAGAALAATDLPSAFGPQRVLAWCPSCARVAVREGRKVARSGPDGARAVADLMAREIADLLAEEDA